MKPFISTEHSFLKHLVQFNRSLVFKCQRDFHFFPGNQRFRIKMIDFALLPVTKGSKSCTSTTGGNILSELLYSGILKLSLYLPCSMVRPIMLHGYCRVFANVQYSWGPLQSQKQKLGALFQLSLKVPKCKIFKLLDEVNATKISNKSN